MLFALLALFALGAVLLSFSPSVDGPKRPTAGDIALARGLIEQMKAAQARAAPVRLNLDNRELRALSGTKLPISS